MLQKANHAGEDPIDHKIAKSAILKQMPNLAKVEATSRVSRCGL